MGEKPDVHATADYILDMSAQLARLATDAKLDLLAYLLDMARLEARLVRDKARTGLVSAGPAVERAPEPG